MHTFTQVPQHSLCIQHGDVADCVAATLPEVQDCKRPLANIFGPLSPLTC